MRVWTLKIFSSLTECRRVALKSGFLCKVRGKHTGPELVVRRLVYQLGYRYRLHVRDLPRQPDLVFRRRKKLIFVHGCFWHHHGGCRLTTIPKTLYEFWENKFHRNKSRDRENWRLLRSEGWRILVIWQCQVKDLSVLQKRLVNFR
jgi:DNA mismatch endonuclease (patch repair protein)